MMIASFCKRSNTKVNYDTKNNKNNNNSKMKFDCRNRIGHCNCCYEGDSTVKKSRRRCHPMIRQQLLEQQQQSSPIKIILRFVRRIIPVTYIFPRHRPAALIMMIVLIIATNTISTVNCATRTPPVVLSNQKKPMRNNRKIPTNFNVQDPSATATSAASSDTRIDMSTTSATSSTITSKEVASTVVEGDDELQQQLQRSQYVRDVLFRRYQYVVSGKRTKDMMQWLKTRKGDATVFSMHGIQQVTTTTNNSNENQNVDYTYAEPILSHSREPWQRKDPFSMDRLNLDLVITPQSPANCFDPTKHSHQLLQQLVQDDLLCPPTILQLIVRTVELVGYHFLYVWTTAFLAICNKPFRTKIWYPLLVQAMGRAGAAWIKWGQWASTRQDMFPAEFCEALSTLYNTAPSHSYAYTKLCIEKSLGISNINDVLDHLDPIPIASGSVAQVHRAILCNGIPVAIKVRHPQVAKLIDIDFRIMKHFALAIESIFPAATQWIHLSESIQQFSHVMAGQALLHVEGHHLELFTVNFQSWANVHFPRPIYATTSIIIETYENGIIAPTLLQQYQHIANRMIQQRNQQQCVDDNTSSSSTSIFVKTLRSTWNDLFTKNRKTMLLSSSTNGGATDTATINTSRNQNKRNSPESTMTEEAFMAYNVVPIPLAKYIVTTGVAIYLKMLLLDNLMHADLHPGNMLVDVPDRRSSFHNSPNEKKSSSNTIIPYDFLSQEEKNASPPLTLSSKDRISVCLVDAGMVAQLTEQEAAIYIGLLTSIGEGDGKQAAKFALQFSIDNNNHLDENERNKFILDMIDLFKERCHGYGTNVDLGNVLRGVLSLLGKHKVRVDANFATLVVNVLCVQGLAFDICPEYNVLDSAKPLLQAYRKLCLTKDGTPIRNPRNSKFVRYRLMSMYFHKLLADNNFFNGLKKKRNESFRRVLLGQKN